MKYRPHGNHWAPQDVSLANVVAELNLLVPYSFKMPTEAELCKKSLDCTDLITNKSRVITRTATQALPDIPGVTPSDSLEAALLRMWLLRDSM